MFNSFIYQLKHWLMAPVQLVMSPGEFMAGRSPRGRALVFGLPAVLMAVFGVAALCWAKFGLADSLEARYKADAEKSGRAKVELLRELETELKMLQAADSGSNTDVATLIPLDDPRRIKLAELQNEERVYWEKLISLKPEEMEYRYQFSLVAIEQGDLQRGLGLMQAIAPSNEPGYGKAHLWLARYLMSRKSDSERERSQLISLALVHVNHCLKRETNNDIAQTARLAKATLLSVLNDFEGAYSVYEELFNDNPIYYEQLVSINQRLNRPELNDQIFNRALVHFESKVYEEGLSVDEWVSSWTNVVSCLAGQRKYAEAEKELLAELERQKTDSNSGAQGAAKRRFVDELLGNLYYSWSRSLTSDSVNRVSEEFKFLKKAYQYSPQNSTVLRGLTRFTLGGDKELAQAARDVYDPLKHGDAPAGVLNELGADALSKQNYEVAIKYFETARTRDPRDSTVLNNLAYTYLVCEDRNPERALKLIDEAIRSLPNSQESQQMLTHFFDTRGNALMQLNRMTEAVAAFEIAIQSRPDNREILEALVKCYQGSNLSPKIYEDRLKKLDEQ